MSFLDLFSAQSGVYASARPRYPDSLFAFIAGIARGRARVWDCATGNGQAAVGLAAWFASVEASDASAAQIAEAAPRPNVHYSVQPAERTTFPDASFDAVCVAQALHWFDHAAFFREVYRVLQPGGVFAAWGYNWFRVSPEIDRTLQELVFDVIAPYWAPNNRMSWNGYRDIPFPFEPIEAPTLPMTPVWTLPETLAFVRSWSATRQAVDHVGNGFLDVAAAELAHGWPAGECRPVALRTHLRVGRFVPYRYRRRPVSWMTCTQRPSRYGRPRFAARGGASISARRVPSCAPCHLWPGPWLSGPSSPVCCTCRPSSRWP